MMKTTVSVLACLLISTSAFAEPMAYQTDSGIEFIPQVKTFYEGNDNISKTEDAKGINSIYTWGIEPSLLTKIERSQYQAQMLYKLKAGFSSDKQNDYDDHIVQLTNFLEINHRHHLVVDYRFQALHEPRGENITEGKGEQLQTPIEFYRNELKTNYVFGAVGAQGRFEFGIGYSDKTYQNYRDNTFGADIEKTKYNDSRSPNAHAEFYLRATPKTYWLVGTRQAITDYLHTKPGTASKNTTSEFYYTGTQWQVTGKSQGIARFGYQVKDFKSSQRETFQGISWDVGIEWQPQQHTLFRIKTAQAAVSPDQEGDYNLQTRYQLSVKHDWNSHLITRLNGTYQTDDYTGATNINVPRQEERYSIATGIDYQIKRWVQLKAGWQYQNKISNLPGYSFSQNIWTLSAQFSL